MLHKALFQVMVNQVKSLNSCACGEIRGKSNDFGLDALAYCKMDIPVFVLFLRYYVLVEILLS